MTTQKHRAAKRSFQLELDFEDMDDIIAEYYDSERDDPTGIADDPTDIVDDVLHEINTNVEYRHLRSFTLAEIEANVIAYEEVMKEAKAVWHRPN